MATSQKKKIPVTILTGFLGAGKTTLLNYILKSKDHGLKFAIIENEFGDVGVDDDILKEEASEEQIVEMMNGCVCCTVRKDLSKVLLKLATRLHIDKFDAVIIETTGLANPSPVAQTFFAIPQVEAHYKLDGIITVVDAKHCLQHLHEHKNHSGRKEEEKNEAVEQIAYADRIILNKVALIEMDDNICRNVLKSIRNINPGAEIMQTNFSEVPPNKLINIGAFDLDKVLELDPKFIEEPGHMHDHQKHKHKHKHERHKNDHSDVDESETIPHVTHKHGSTVGSVSFKFEGDLHVNKLQNWIAGLIRNMGENLYRYKGILAVKGMKQKFVFQGVHMLFNGHFSKKCWGATEKRESRLVFIGKKLDKKALQDGLQQCKDQGGLRFKVGDKVQANVGTWFNAVVVKLWDEGHPYRLELQDGHGTQVWGPEDSDMYVRKPPEKRHAPAAAAAATFDVATITTTDTAAADNESASLSASPPAPATHSSATTTTTNNNSNTTEDPTVTETAPPPQPLAPTPDPPVLTHPIDSI